MLGTLQRNTLESLAEAVHTQMHTQRMPRNSITFQRLPHRPVNSTRT